MTSHLGSVRRRVVVASVLVVVVAGITAVAAMAALSTGVKPEHWGIIDRNTIGSPVGELRDGPWVAGAGMQGQPPFGKGSLGIEVGNGSEKVAFGNEYDFTGDNFLDVNQVGYRVFQTGEDANAPVLDKLGNLPNITFELDPNLSSSATNYTSLVWVPGPNDPSNVNKWSPYIDATTDGAWYFTGAAGAATSCNQTTMCSFTLMKSKLSDGDGFPTILSVAISKGRDDQFQGAVDGLRLNSKVYDFEAQPDGVKERAA